MPETPDDTARFLSEYPPLQQPGDGDEVRGEVRRRKYALQLFADNGYQHQMTITTLNHRDGSHRRIDVLRLPVTAEPVL